jgi:hypothetical protein
MHSRRIAAIALENVVSSAAVPISYDLLRRACGFHFYIPSSSDFRRSLLQLAASQTREHLYKRIRNVEDWLAERGEFELPVPISEQSVGNIRRRSSPHAR